MLLMLDSTNWEKDDRIGYLIICTLKVHISCILLNMETISQTFLTLKLLSNFRMLNPTRLEVENFYSVSFLPTNDFWPFFFLFFLEIRVKFFNWLFFQRSKRPFNPPSFTNLWTLIAPWSDIYWPWVKHLENLTTYFFRKQKSGIRKKGISNLLFWFWLSVWWLAEW